MKEEKQLPDETDTKEADIIDDVDIQTTKKTSLTRITTIIQSPFPPPELLEKYKQIDPSFPQRVLKMVEEEQKHRHKITSRGQIFALMIGMGGLITTLILGIWGNPWVAGMIGFTSLATLVGAFLESRRMENKN